MSKFAYDIGAALGMMKSGSVERVEKENTKLLKIAKLLQKKGKLTKAAFKWPWDYSGVDHTPAERQKQIGEKVTAAGVTTKERGGGGSADPLTEAGDDLISRGQGTKGTFASIRQGAPTSSKGKKGNKGIISLNDSDGGDENGVLSLNPGTRKLLGTSGGLAAQGEQGVQGGPSKEEQGFWGGPKFGDMQRFWLQMLGKTPSQAASEDLAREAGYGRAVEHKKNLDWIKSMLMGPQMGHYGMGG